MHSQLCPYLLCLIWIPRLALAAVQVLVQSTLPQPGDVLQYAIEASPIPTGTVGMFMVAASSPDKPGGRLFFPFSLTVTESPQQLSFAIPTTMPAGFYTLDMHTNTSVYSDLLGSSDIFQLSPLDTPSSTTASADQSVLSTLPITSQDPTSSSIATTAAPAISSSSATNDPQPKKKTAIGPIIGGVIGGLVILFALLGGCFLLRRRRRMADSAYSGTIETPGPPTGQVPGSAEMLVSPYSLDNATMNPQGSHTRDIPSSDAAGFDSAGGYIAPLYPTSEKERLRRERARVESELSELQPLRYPRSQTPSDAMSSRESNRDDEMRQRVEILTAQVHQLENALHSTTHGFEALSEAPPEYGTRAGSEARFG
ncbi:hypothetical protein BDQ12DRAFT_765513 [Crucibulum laeve]|uniref:Uncharacterized protein n=1 Tax=Crucibulum laeve TaxID=68775 RepID=A0A5C3LMJ3_9AGAR|nr:hypothetical protein BDQ12DRAFT_765513 [Crucibulum laeve]